MVSDWRDCALGDVIELKRGYDLPRQDRHPGPFPVVSSSGVTDHHLVAKAQGPGVVTGRYGTLGQVYYIEKDFWPLNTTLYVRDFKGNDPRFINYFLRGLDFLAYSDKAAVPGLNRNHLHQARVRFPTNVSEQRAIAQILGTLDDKIELNRRVNRTLESFAKALFVSWFVDFQPVHAKAEGHDPRVPKPIADLLPEDFEASELGKIPSGWAVRSLDEIARFMNGLAMQKYPPEGGRSLPVIKIAQMRAGNLNGADLASVDIDPNYIVHDGDILFSWSGSLECVIWAGGEGALNQHLFKVTSATHPRWLSYLGIHLHLDEFRNIAAGKATTMGHIQRHHLSGAKLAVPPRDLINAMGAVFEPLVESTWHRKAQSRTLATMREMLLPKLISGDLRIKDPERLIG